MDLGGTEPYHGAVVASSELGTWAAVTTYLQAAGAKPSPAGTVLSLEVMTDGRPVSIFVSMVRFHSGSDWLALSVSVCAVDELVLRGALVANASLPIGALVISGANVGLRQTLPLAGLHTEQLEAVLASLARMALSLRAAAETPDATAAGVPFAYSFRPAG